MFNVQLSLNFKWIFWMFLIFRCPLLFVGISFILAWWMSHWECGQKFTIKVTKWKKEWNVENRYRCVNRMASSSSPSLVISFWICLCNFDSIESNNQTIITNSTLSISLSFVHCGIYTNRQTHHRTKGNWIHQNESIWDVLNNNLFELLHFRFFFRVDLY